MGGIFAESMRKVTLQLLIQTFHRNSFSEELQLAVHKEACITVPYSKTVSPKMIFAQIKFVLFLNGYDHK